MHRRIALVATLLAIAPGLAGRPAAEEMKQHETAGAASPADPRWERIKSLAGIWEGKAGFGEPTEQANVTYRLTAGGTVLVETLFGGTEHEMMTMYHMDGADLILTHYCAMGNQPRMRCVSPKGDSTLKFEFLDATGLPTSQGAHMHAAWIAFDSPDRIRAGWTLYDGGKATGEARFDMARKS